MRVSLNFVLEEFVDPGTYKRYGEKSIWFIDPKVINIAQLLRDLTGSSVTINNWKVGGSYSLSGLRPFKSIGAKMSQHKFGRGIDVKIKGWTPEDIHELIKDNWVLFKKEGLTVIEDVSLTPSWTHLDCRFTGLDYLLIVGL
jgi:hypothetical protein